ncbi:anthrone oxygenase family protein [Nocardiopsis trehalosi]|uniref:anthrone oxygenase family protein n=1 Tax=Nocardiopsis trehalosi TaxID=109329 RepID=UPI000830D670|nr:anthrone oxygenase family protein [Nocardiopsis trehalosi]
MAVVSGAALVAAVVATGVFAGVFYGFTVAVMPGLARVDDAAFVRVMRRINAAILNGWFLGVFGGAPVLLAAALAADVAAGAGAWPLIGAALAACVAAVGATAVVNVPMNEALEAAGDPAGAGEAARARAAFERRWVRWNTVRTVLSVLALGLAAWALAVHAAAG